MGHILALIDQATDIIYIKEINSIEQGLAWKVRLQTIKKFHYFWKPPTCVALLKFRDWIIPEPEESNQY
jgi:hypothetical protein